MTEQPSVSRRDELLELAATMFAERGLRATTVRDIADSAGILSGSLYHHFTSQGGDGRRGVARLPRLAVRSLPGDRRHRAQPAGAAQGPVHGVVRGDRAPARAGRHLPGRGQATVRRRRGSPTWRSATKSNARCGWTCSTRASRRATSAPIINVDLVYRFIRDTTWVSVRWYQPGGPLTAEQVGRQYLAIVLGGITTTDYRKELKGD